MNASRRKFFSHIGWRVHRHFVKRTIPNFLARAAAAELSKSKDSVLVVVQLTGGNDGLNTVVPYNEDAYRKAHPKLAIPTKTC